MKKRKPANFNYDFTGLAVEVTGDDLYIINGGAEVENSHQGVANAQVGDTITRSNGQVVVLKQYDIDLAQEQLGGGENEALRYALTTPLENQMGAMFTPENKKINSNKEIDFSKFSTAQEAFQALGYKTEPSASPSLTKQEIDKIIQRNPEAYASPAELLEEWESANRASLKDGSNNKSGIGFGFKSIDSAALYWAKTYGDDSIVTGHEYASAIFGCDYVVKQEDGTTKRKTRYFYNKPQEGYEDSNGKYSNISWNFENCIAGSGHGVESIYVVSAIHSHGNADDTSANCMSDTDYEGVDKAKSKYNTHTGKEYLVTPYGHLKEFGGNNNMSLAVNISDDCARDIRIGMSEDFMTSDFAKEIFALYTNAYYHPDTFFAYTEKK